MNIVALHKKNTALFNAFKFLVSFGLLYLVFRNIDLVNLGSQIVKTSPLSLFLYFVINMLLVLLVSFRWSMLVLNKPSMAEIFQFYKANLVALFYNLFLPTAYGGDLVKWTQLESLQLRKRTLILSVFADRLMGVMGLIVVGSIATILSQIFSLAQVPTVILALFLTLTFGLVMLLIIVFSPLRFSQLPFLKKFPQLTELDDYIDVRKKRFLFLFLLAIIIQMLSFFSFYILALEARLDISFTYFLIVSPVIALISVLPISVAGFGTTEATYLYFFTPLGAAKENILLFTSLFGIFKIIFGVVGWVTELMISSKNLTRRTIKH